MDDAGKRNNVWYLEISEQGMMVKYSSPRKWNRPENLQNAQLELKSLIDGVV